MELQTKKRRVEEQNIYIHVLPSRIQAGRLKVLIECCKRNQFPVANGFCDRVTHILTEFDSAEQVWRTLSPSNSENNSRLTSVEILSTKWLFDSAKVGSPISGADLGPYRVKSEARNSEETKAGSSLNTPTAVGFPAYACQRRATLCHRNTNLVYELEVLVKHANFRDNELLRDSSRALAFSNSIAVLKCLSFEVTRIEQIENLPGMGQHGLKVIRSILDDGKSSEVEEIRNSEWYKSMQIFTSVYGIGSSTAKKLFDSGLRTFEDLTKYYEKSPKNSRISHGIKYFDDLSIPLTVSNAERILELVEREASHILSALHMNLVGGFRRGKSVGHDVDILIHHPINGATDGFLLKLRDRLSDHDYLLHCDHIRSSMDEEGDPLASSGQPGRRLNTMDHFEKLFLVFKLPLADERADNRSTGDVVMGNCADVSCPVVNMKARNWIAARVDLIVCPAAQYAYALVGWTGNKHFNRSLRRYAKREMRLTLTSHNLWDQKQKCLVEAKTEEDVFKNLCLDYVLPCQRNM